MSGDSRQPSGVRRPPRQALRIPVKETPGLRRWLPWAVAAVGVFVLSAAGIAAFVTLRPQSTDAKSRGLTIGELSQMYPVPFMGESAWLLVTVDRDEASFARKNDNASRDMVELFRKQRQWISEELRKMSASEQATAEFYGSRLPYCSIASLMERSNWIVPCLAEHPNLYNTDALKKRVAEYVAAIGGEEEFKKRHPKQEFLLRYCK